MSVSPRVRRCVHALTVLALTACAAASISTVSAPPAIAAAPGSQTFVDNFDGPAGTAPNRAVWSPQVGGNWGNGKQLQYTTDRTANAALTGTGKLVITAKGETYHGWDATRDYTSARLMTTTAFTYGTISAKIKMSGDQGAWPAFWTLGANYQQVGWPTCGELDVMESLNALPNLYGSLHGPVQGGAKYQSYDAGKMISPNGGLAGGWHTYSAQWSRKAISFSLDGRVYARVTKADLPAGNTWAMDNPQQLILNIAVGDWAGTPAAPADFRATMTVDWVKVTGTTIS